MTAATTASASVGDTEESRAFLQARLAFFARTIFWLFGLVLIGELGLFYLFPEAEPKGISFIDWVKSDAYDPVAIKGDFQESWWGTILTDKLLRRE